MRITAVVAFLMCVGKCVAYWLTPTAAVFSDAAESAVHLLATGISAFSLWYAERPPDHNHPYGHAKIVYFSAALEGVVIFSAALSIAWMAMNAWSTGALPEQLSYGLIILLVLAAVNGYLGYYLCRTGKDNGHLVLCSHGQHLLADMWTSLGVVVGVVVARLTGFLWLDPLVAVLVAGHILWTSLQLLTTSFHGLMERSCPETQELLQEKLDDAVRQTRLVGFHQLKHRYVNNQLWVEVHLEFQPELSIKEAHDDTSQIEMELAKVFSGRKIWITTHLEPEGHAAAHPQGHFEFSPR